MTNEETNELLLAITKMSDRQVDPKLKELIEIAIEKDNLEEKKTAVYKALDFAVYFGLCSNFEVMALDIVWQELGGKMGDPAPWRDGLL